jgi:hypothetical protein
MEDANPPTPVLSSPDSDEESSLEEPKTPYITGDPFNLQMGQTRFVNICNARPI